MYRLNLMSAISVDKNIVALLFKNLHLVHMRVHTNSIYEVQKRVCNDLN